MANEAMPSTAHLPFGGDGQDTPQTFGTKREDESVTAFHLRLAREEWTRPYREALLELHSAGLALVPHMPPLPAQASIRWDEAMGAADELLKAGA